MRIDQAPLVGPVASMPAPANGIETYHPLFEDQDSTLTAANGYLVIFQAPITFTAKNMGFTLRGSSAPSSTGAGTPIFRIGLFTATGGTAGQPFTPVAYTDNQYAALTSTSHWYNFPVKWAGNLSTDISASGYTLVQGTLYAIGMVYALAGNTEVNPVVIRAASTGTGASALNNTRSPRIAAQYNTLTDFPAAPTTLGAISTSPNFVPYVFLN